MKKKRNVILETRYIGEVTNDGLESLFASWRKWSKWKAYYNLKSAKEAKRNLERKYSRWEFRIKRNQSKKNKV